MAYGDFKDKVLKDKSFSTAKNPKYDRYERALASMVHKFFYKEISGAAIKTMPNQQLGDELHKPIIRKFKKEEFILHLKTKLGVLI